MEKVTIQKIVIHCKDKFDVAEKYFKVLSDINGLNLTERDLQVLAFTGSSGNMSDKDIRNEFCERFGTTVATLNNITSKMRKMGLMTKDGTVIKLARVVNIDFAKQLKLDITMGYESTKAVDVVQER